MDDTTIDEQEVANMKLWFRIYCYPCYLISTILSFEYYDWVALTDLTYYVMAAIGIALAVAATIYWNRYFKKTGEMLLY